MYKRQTRAPLAKLVEQLETRVGEGDASGYDLARFELELSEHDDRLAEADAEYSASRVRLGALLGEAGGAIEPSDALGLPVSSQTSNPSSAAAQRSDVQAMAAASDSAKALLRAAKRWWVPTLDLSAGYMNTDLGPGSGPGADLAHGYTAAITASVPLFSRGDAEKRRGEARSRRVRAHRLILERQISVEVRVAEGLLRSRVERARLYESKQLAQVATLVHKTESAYHGGEASALELRDAYRQVAAAKLRHIDLRFHSRMAELDLWRATGKRGGTSK